MSCISRDAGGRLVEERRFVRDRMAVIAVSAVLLTAPFVYSPYVARGPVLCPLHGVAGLPCPGCGLTRAFCALTQGDWTAALKFNALSLPLIALLSAALVVAHVELVRGRRCTFYRFAYSRRLGWICGGLVATYHAGRVLWWTADGTLANEYLRTSWTYALFAWFG